MNTKSLIRFDKYTAIISFFSIPILWWISVYFEILYSSFLWFTVYTWFYIVAWYSVVLVMAIRPIADIFPTKKYLRQLCILRRSFWVISATIIITIMIYSWITLPSSFPNFFSYKWWSIWYPIISRLSEITAIVLLITSNNYAKKVLKKYWKRIQRSSYIYFTTWWILALRYWDEYFVNITLYGVISLFILAEILKKYSKHIK